ncbi:MAG TPA: bifunctional UDP-N-acetylglucosamine diphosphorylase/glucosamine-1-phosphate N-acetyltransferase GlmU [Solirubrobacterales bacterium]|nr:bifunctional UDP-N-acetylglucosamine diphosphorylase/glucosamine-1-phosphate N-acetyltransferase GlmU [Solirubrobacterales bacterium]
MNAPTALIMAAGQGTRMRSDLPKVLHEICGRPMVAWPILAAKEAGAGRICVIVSPDRDLSSALPDGTETIVQPEADGTGGALRAASDVVGDSETVVILSGDHPLVSAPIIDELISTHRETGAAATVMTTEMEDPGSYGRIVRGSDGDIERIVEAKAPGDATPEELAIKEVNAGTYAFAGPSLAEALGRLDNDNAQGEYYLGDVLPMLRESGLKVAAYRAPDPGVNLGINDRADLARVADETRRRILTAHMRAGVTIEDPGATWIDADVEIAPDTTILPGTTLRGRSSVGTGSAIGPMTTLIDSRIGERASVIHSYLTSCEVADEAKVGPFTYLRPDARIGRGAKAGTFVEIKNSDIGAGAKVPHLSYIGDTDVGEGSNLGASTVTANYDGRSKNRTKIGKKVFTGVDTTFVAPVEVGDEAYTGAGSVITDDVPPGALGISRAEQRNIEGYAGKKAKESSEDEDS